MEELGILSKRVHDHLGYAGVEVDLGDNFILLNDVLQLAVCEQDELFGRRVDLLRHVRLLGRVSGLWAGLALTEDLGQLVDALGLLDLADDAVALLDQVADDLLEEAHARMLARVSEVVQVVLQLLRRAVVNANVDQFCLKAIWSVKIKLQRVMRLTIILSIIELLPLILRFCRARLRIWTAACQSPLARNCSDCFSAVSGVTYYPAYPRFII